MGIFSTNRAVAESGVLSKNIDNVIPALESANYTAMGIELVAESEANYNAIMKAIGVGELNYFEENGCEIVYESSGSNNFFEKIKQFFVKLWDKIKEIFHKFFVWLDSLVKSDAKFVAKYQKEAEERWSKLTDDNFTFKGYKFSIPDFKPETVNTTIKTALFKGTTGFDNGVPTDTTKEDADKFVQNIKDKDSKAIARAAAIKSLNSNFSSDTIEDSEFTKELKKVFRSDKEEKEDIKKSELSHISEYCTKLKGYKEEKSKAESTFDSFKRAFESTIKSIEDAKNKFNKQETSEALNAETKSAHLAAYNTVIQLNKDSLETTVTVNGAFLQALKDEAAQAKQIITKVMTTTIKPKNESAGVYESAESMDFLAGVVLK